MRTHAKTGTEPQRIWRTPASVDTQKQPDRIITRRAKLVARGVPLPEANQAAGQIERAINWGDPLQVRLPTSWGAQGIWALLAFSNNMDMRRGRPSGSIFDTGVQVWMMSQGRFFRGHLDAVRRAGRGRALP